MSVNTRLLSSYLAVVCGLSLVCATTAAWGQADDKAAAKDAPIPVKRIVMFSSGVAFYERNGEVDGDATIDLKFNTRDINDLLKSMVLQDEGGGRVSTVSYGSKDPITRALRTFSIDLTSNPTLADLLAQVRGEKIEIDSPSAMTGTIVGVEKRTKPVGDKQSVEVTYLNLLTEDGLRSVALDSVGRIKLSNPKLDAELRQALMVLAMGNTKDKKSQCLASLPTVTGKLTRGLNSRDDRQVGRLELLLYLHQVCRRGESKEFSVHDILHEFLFRSIAGNQ